jgi:hypothetical protein
VEETVAVLDPRGDETESARRGYESPLQDRVIFLVGAQRSGTNWLQRMLSAHPEIVGLPAETHFFSHGIAPLKERFHHGPSNSTTTGATYMDPQRLRESLRRFSDDVLAEQWRMLAPDASRILERTPLHVHHLKLISDVYPDAWVIHIIRDGCEVACSLRAQSWGPETMTEAAREWASAIRDARSASVPRYREVRYEELLARPVDGVSELLTWLQLPVDDDVRTMIARGAEKVFNVTRGSKSIRPDKWRAQLSPQDVADFRREAGETMTELGYPLPESAPEAAPPARNRLDGGRIALAGLAARVREWRPRQPETRGATELQVVTTQRYMAELGLAVDRFVELVALHDYQALGQLVSPTAEIVISTAQASRASSGREGLEMLQQALASDEPRRARLMRDETVKHVVGATIIQNHRGTDGACSDTVYILQTEWTGQKVLLQKIVFHTSAPA